MSKTKQPAKRLRLWDLPEGAKIICQTSDGSSFIIFHHVDGMYSYCKSEKGEVVHLNAGAPVKKKGKAYVIDSTG